MDLWLLLVPMLSNDPPTFPPTSSRQILQLYCPDSRAAGAQATKGRRRGCMERWDGKENGQSGDKRGRNRTPYPVLTSKPTHPSPHPASTPMVLLPCNSLFCSTAFPHVRRVQTANGAAWRYQALLGMCGRGQRAGLAIWPCGGSSPLPLNQQRRSNDYELL